MKVIFFYGPIVFHAHHQGYQNFTNWMMQGSSPLLSPIKWIFYYLMKEPICTMKLDAILLEKEEICDKNALGNLNEISFSRKQGFVPVLCSHLTFVKINVVSYMVYFWQVFPTVNKIVLEYLF